MSGWCPAACFAEFGVEVVGGRQGRGGKIEALRAARSRSTSPAWTIWSKRNAAGRLTFTTDLPRAVRAADAVFIAVGTPSRRGDGHADLTYVFAAAEEIARG